uniref:CHAD domain-containing protein n=1 Tax=Halomonas sp. TaxID=1486246 RepID=UPI0026264F80|nr:CHAD domain-containing protein [Halomonas sp.]
MAKPLVRRRLGTVFEATTIELLDEACRAFPRIQDPQDSEGLHDFRVALRRLRSLFKDYIGYFPARAPRKLVTDLRDLARSTNTARDAEVMLAWLESQAEGAPAAERGAIAWWKERLSAQVDDEYAGLKGSVASFPLLDNRLRSAVKSLRKASSKTPRFGAVSAEVLEYLTGKLGEELSAMRGREDEDALHRPRITGKRIRYLLRPWRKEGELFEKTEASMKAFQEAFGDLHDDLVRAEVLRTTVHQHVWEETELRLEAAVSTSGARAMAPRHLRGFMGLVAQHEQHTENNLQRVMALVKGPNRQQLDTCLAEAIAYMRG